MRIYLASTLPALARALAERRLTEGPVTGFAVTPALREAYLEDDLEELEYAALTAAARQSLVLLSDDGSAARRRVVLAVDVPDSDVGQVAGGDPASVCLLQPLPWSALASLQVDARAAEPTVAAAAAALGAANADPDAQLALDRAQDQLLLWYAAQEAEDLIAEVGG